MLAPKIADTDINDLTDVPKKTTWARLRHIQICCYQWRCLRCLLGYKIIELYMSGGELLTIKLHVVKIIKRMGARGMHRLHICGLLVPSMRAERLRNARLITAHMCSDPLRVRGGI